MEKVRTVVKIGGREYALAGYDPEEYIHRVAIYVDRKMAELTAAGRGMSTSSLGVLASINIADELIRIKEEAIRLRDKVAELQMENARLQAENARMNKELTLLKDVRKFSEGYKREEE